MAKARLLNKPTNIKIELELNFEELNELVFAIAATSGNTLEDLFSDLDRIEKGAK